MTRTPRGRAIAAGIVFLAVSALALVSAGRDGQLGSLGGITDEYLALGLKLRANGTLGLSRDEPTALRPPGYPAFVAAVVWAALPDPSRTNAAAFQGAARRVLPLAQALVLAGSSAALVLWLSETLSLEASLAAGALLGLNPHSLALVGLFHYDLVHWFCLILAAWASERALRSERPALALVGAGLVWGVSNLVRPVTLLLPGFLLVAWWWLQRRPLRTALVWSLSLSLGLALALAPWTARNLHVTGRLVPVADNPWATLWGQTVKAITPDPNRYVWFELYQDELMPIFTRVTGSPVYDYVLQNRRGAELDRAFRAEALRHLREQPLVYLGNAARAFASFASGFSSVFVSALAHVQRCMTAAGSAAPALGVPQSWFLLGRAQDFHPPGLARVYLALAWLVTALAAAGFWAGARRADAPVVPLAALACVAVTQSLFFLHMMHYYVKWPFLLAAAASGLDRWLRGDQPKAALARTAALALVLVGLGSSLWLLFGPLAVDRPAR